MDKNNKNGNIWRKKVEKMCVFKEAEGAEVKGVPVKKREEGDRGEGKCRTHSIDSDFNPAHRQLAHFPLSASHVGGGNVS